MTDNSSTPFRQPPKSSAICSASLMSPCRRGFTLPAPDREVFWRFVEENTVARPPIAGLKRKAIWIRPGLAATVRHLRGERLLRHATLTAVYPKSNF